MRRFLITEQPIVAWELDDPTAGASVVFEGRVRNHNDGQVVESLFYECYEGLAINEGERILQDAISRFDIVDAKAVHRIGALSIGDVAIRVQAIAHHRKAAFDACDWAMDEIKRQVPIWKQERYAKGAQAWLGHGLPKPPAVEDSYDIHSRQVLLPEVGEQGQVQLSKARVLVAGAGGLGSPALMYLAVAGIGEIEVVDPDIVEASNLNRQPLFSVSDLGACKADAAARNLHPLAPGCQVTGRVDSITSGNARESVDGFDAVLDCTDDLAAKFALNDACRRKGIPLVSASVHRWHGQIMTVNDGACLRCIWHEEPPAWSVRGCEEEGIMGACAGFFGVLQAAEALKSILGMGTATSHSLLIADLRDFSVMRIERSPGDGCPICNPDAPSSSQQAPQIDLDLPEVEALEGVVFVDVRVGSLSCLPAKALGWGEWSAALEDLRQADRPVVLVCQRGVTSSRRAHLLCEQGWSGVFSLKGGLDRWCSDGAD